MTSHQSFRLECIRMPPSYYAGKREEQQEAIEVDGDVGADDSLNYSTSFIPSQNNEAQPSHTEINGRYIGDIENNNHEKGVSSNSTSVEDDPRIPMMEEVLKELRCTENILVSEIGRDDLLSFLRHLLVANEIRRETNEENQRRLSNGSSRHCRCDHWDFKDDNAFFYLMEIIQANFIYFLKHRYFEQKRGRFYGKKKSVNDPAAASAVTNTNPNRRPENQDVCSCWTEASVLQDFHGIFTKAAACRYFPTRSAVVEFCFEDDAKKAASAVIAKKIRRALVRLHRRAGIFLPHTKPTVRHHEYWVALWWTCSSMMLWCLDPCLEITRLVDEDFCRCDPPLSTLVDPTKPPPKQKRKLINSKVLQSHKATVSLDLIRREIRKVGLPFDNVLMHSGPWEIEDEGDEDFTLQFINADTDVKDQERTTVVNDGDDNGDDESEIAGDQNWTVATPKKRNRGSDPEEGLQPFDMNLLWDEEEFDYSSLEDG